MHVRADAPMIASAEGSPIVALTDEGQFGSRTGIDGGCVSSIVTTLTESLRGASLGSGEAARRGVVNVSGVVVVGNKW